MPSDNPVLVAPRPIRFNTLLARNRILSGPDLFERARVSEDISDTADDRKTPAISLGDSDKELSSPSARSSPRSLPTEALEEFLSILRPSFFPPSSPVLLTRRHAGVSLPALHQERPYSRKGRALLQDLSDDLDIARSTQSSRNMSTPDGETFDDYDMNTIPVRWFTSNVLSSPISRMNTRNPFQRQSSYADQLSPGSVSPISLSPAAIPLPLPSPEESL